MLETLERKAGSIHLMKCDLLRLGNPMWRIQNLYKIQTKTAGQLIQFNPNNAQREMLKKMAVYNKFIILKCRQIGISTLFLLWHLDATLFTPNTTTAIIAHEKKSLQRLFKMIKIAYENMPNKVVLSNGEVWYKPKAKYDTKNELEFEGINSRIYVALEVRSDTLHRVHVSEGAFLKNGEDALTATLGAVPDDGVITIESTANGIGGIFYEMWEEAVAEDSESPYYAQFFSPAKHEEYQRELPGTIEEFKQSMDQYEQMLHEKYQVPLTCLSWRRHRMSDTAARKKFKQEFPFFAREAFLHTGKPVFDLTMLDDWIITKPIESKMEGRLMYWQKPQKEGIYTIVCDTASGMGAEAELGDSTAENEGGTDYSVIQVWDVKKLKMVAMFRAKWPYAKLHEPLLRLAREYNNGYIIVEATDHGLTVLNNIKHSNYPTQLVHKEERYDQQGRLETTKMGFATNKHTRPLIIDELEANILDGTIRCHSRRVQSECFRFVLKDNGRAEAMKGYKDDCVLAMAIGTYGPNIERSLRAQRMYDVSKSSLQIK